MVFLLVRNRLSDLSATCDDLIDPINNIWDGCVCTDARRRIKSGEIDCNKDECPANCEVCKVCLYYVEDCIDVETPAPVLTRSPTPRRPPRPTPQPVPSTVVTREPSVPTAEPSSRPSRGGFDINDCNTYSNDWTLDLGQTCEGNFLDNDYTGCDCMSARTRLANGEIDCDVDKPCPDGCTACQICLYYVIKGECLNWNPGKVSKFYIKQFEAGIGLSRQYYFYIYRIIHIAHEDNLWDEINDNKQRRREYYQ